MANDIPTRHFETDVLIVGGGAAATMAAFECAEAGIRVIQATKGRATSGTTSVARGGFAAAMGKDDSAEEHLADILEHGGELIDPALAKIWTHDIKGLVLRRRREARHAHKWRTLPRLRDQHNAAARVGGDEQRTRVRSPAQPLDRRRGGGGDNAAAAVAGLLHADGGALVRVRHVRRGRVEGEDHISSNFFLPSTWQV